MKKLSYAAAAAAIVMASSARAHELACEKTIDGGVVHEITHYPAKLHFRVAVINTHPTDASTALAVRDDVMEALGIAFTPAAPFTLGVGKSAEFAFDVTMKDRAQCLQLAKVQACGASFEDLFEVDFDGGSAQCAARIICGPESGDDGGGGDNGGGVCKYDADCPSHHHCDHGQCEPDDDHGGMCKYDADCPAHHHCDHGQCKPDDDHGGMCKYDADCPSHHHCDHGQCKPDDDHGGMCKYDADCPSHHHCDHGQCKPEDDHGGMCK